MKLVVVGDYITWSDSSNGMMQPVDEMRDIDIADGTALMPLVIPGSGSMVFAMANGQVICAEWIAAYVIRELTEYTVQPQVVASYMIDINTRVATKLPEQINIMIPVKTMFFNVGEYDCVAAFSINDTWVMTEDDYDTTDFT